MNCSFHRSLVFPTNPWKGSQGNQIAPLTPSLKAFKMDFAVQAWNGGGVISRAAGQLGWWWLTQALHFHDQYMAVTGWTHICWVALDLQSASILVGMALVTSQHPWTKQPLKIGSSSSSDSCLTRSLILSHTIPARSGWPGSVNTMLQGNKSGVDRKNVPPRGQSCRKQKNVFSGPRRSSQLTIWMGGYSGAQPLPGSKCWDWGLHIEHTALALLISPVSLFSTSWTSSWTRWGKGSLCSNDSVRLYLCGNATYCRVQHWYWTYYTQINQCEASLRKQESCWIRPKIHCPLQLLPRNY